MPRADIQQEIRTFLTENFLFGQANGFTDDTPLLGNVIDSTGVLQLVIHLQAQFAITIGDEEVTTENLGTVKDAAEFVERKLIV